MNFQKLETIINSLNESILRFCYFKIKTSVIKFYLLRVPDSLLIDLISDFGSGE